MIGQAQVRPGFGERARRFLVVLLFLVVPLALALFGNRLLLLTVEEPLEAEAENRLDEALNQIEAERDPFEYYSKSFRQLEQKVFSAADPLAAWKKAIPGLRRRFRNRVDLIFLDGTGKPVKGFADRPITGVLAKKFFAAYHVFLTEKKPLTETAVSFLKSFLGSFLPAERECHGRLHWSLPPPDDQFVYFSRPHPGGMIILFLRPTRPLQEMALLEQFSRIRRRSPQLRLALARRGERARGVLRELGLKGGIPAGFWKSLGRSADGKAWFGRNLLARRAIFPTIWVVGRATAPAPALVFHSLFRDARTVHALVWALILALAVTLYPFENLITSVRLKLVMAFLYTVLVPLIIMAMTAGTFLSERGQVLEGLTHQKAERSMISLDNLFEQFWKNLREKLRSHHYAPNYAGTDSYEEFTRNLEGYRKEYGFDFCRIFDAKGRQVLEFYDPEVPTLFGGLIKMFPKLARGMFIQNRILLEDSIPGNASGTDPGGSQKVDPLLALAQVSYSPFLTQEVTLGDVHGYIGTVALSSDGRRLMFQAYLVWFRKKMEWNYLQEKLTSLARTRGSDDVLVWAPDTPELVRPEGFRYAGLCQPLIPKVNSSTRSFRTRVRGKDGDLLITGLKGTNLKHFSFLIVTSDLEIRREIRDLTWKFRFITLAILGICLIVGFLLARLFLTPLGNLTGGMEAISRREFRRAIPVSAPDELGELAALFNGAMEDLRDLEVATTVQESLFPRVPLRMGPWEVFGSCVSASQVGGDYFDYFPLDDHRAVIIIGDVSGHGVGAALVVAMAKAIIGHPSTSGKPLEILASMNTILFTILKRRKMMSCCLAIFDRSTGVLTLGNAGQSFPILLGKGNPRFLELKGYPLGSTRNWKATSETFGVQEDEVVLFYTDGLIEARDRDGQPVGYDRFMTELPGLVRGSAPATEQAIRRWHRQLTREGPPEDDISLIVLQWNRETGVPA